MLWKIGLAMVVLGMVITASSCHFFSSMAQQVSGQRQVSTSTVQPGKLGFVSAEVDPQTRAKVRVEARLEIPRAVLDEGAVAGITEFRVPLNLVVEDAEGQTLHREAGVAKTTDIVPEPDSPHFDGFDPVVTASLETQGFAPAENGYLRIAVDAADVSERGYPVQRIQVSTMDRIPEDLQKQAVGGVLSLVVGPGVSALGGLLFLIGLFLRSTRKSPSALNSSAASVSSSPTRSVGRTVPPAPPASRRGEMDPR